MSVSRGAMNVTASKDTGGMDYYVKVTKTHSHYIKKNNKNSFSYYSCWQIMM